LRKRWVTGQMLRAFLFFFGTYALAAVATTAIVAWALRGGRQAPEGAIIGYTGIFVILWGVFFFIALLLGR
jgi:uncharacterized membrane protein YidH (DUF202 family)